MQWTRAAYVIFFDLPQLVNNLFVIADQSDFQVEVEGTDIHVARANHCDIVIDANRFRMQYHRGLVTVDVHSSFQQLFLVRTLRMVHQKLISDLGYDEIHFYTALGCRREREDKGLVRHDIRISDGDTLPRGMEKRHK